MNIRRSLLGLVGLIAVSGPAHAATTLNFEGLADDAPVGNFYAPNYVFSASARAIIDSDAGGTGNFANEPSANTILIFLDAASAVLNVPNGFTTGFSFYYSSYSATAVSVWSGANATGTLLGSINLAAQHDQNCSGDPTGQFCNWTAAGVNFAGTAMSIDFGDTANRTGFDDITFGSDTPGGVGAVPEPAAWAMMIAGFGLAGGSLRRRRAKLAYAA